MLLKHQLDLAQDDPTGVALGIGVMPQDEVEDEQERADRNGKGAGIPDDSQAAGFWRKGDASSFTIRVGARSSKPSWELGAGSWELS
ncbi:MAG TPA: hypothetical protein VFS19_00150 [Planctomycetota bacterium]|nr:hypothetical protein [Planctomycetota bacterium]